MKALFLAGGLLGVLAGPPCMAQSPRPSPSPRKETPSYTSDDLDRLAGRTPGEAPKASPAPPPPPQEQPREFGAPDPFEIKIERTREGHEGEGPDPAQASWRDRALALREALAQAEAHVKELDSQAQALLWQYLQSTDTNEILSLKAEQQEILDQIPDAKKAVEEAQKTLADFEREAAQAGVPPGEIKEKKTP